MSNPTRRGAWTSSEDDVLRALVGTARHADIAVAVGRSVNAVRQRCSALGLRTKADTWTAEEEAFLVEHYRMHADGVVGLSRLEAQLGRSRSNICRKARSLGLETNRRRKRDDAWREAGSVAAVAWIAERGHPRGAKGMRHTAESREKMSRAHIENAQQQTPEERSRRGILAAQTRVERYGSAGPMVHMAAGANPYSRTKSGKREDLGGQFFRSSWEANYARYLNWLVEKGEVRSWEYEPEVFRFEGVNRGPYTYTPDFRVVERDGSVAFHEVKGWMDSASRSRLARMKKFYPDVTLVVIDQDVYRSIEKWKEIIPGWEGRVRL